MVEWIKGSESAAGILTGPSAFALTASLAPAGTLTTAPAALLLRCAATTFGVAFTAAESRLRTLALRT